MTFAMQRVAPLVSKGIGDYLTNYKTWGTVMYNVLENGLVGDGVTDDTAALQTLVNMAIAAGRKAIFFPHTETGGKYFVTTLTNADQVVLFGDNSSFVGGYAGTINQIGDWVTSQELEGISITPLSYGAFGNGITNDTAAFNSLESQHVGMLIDLLDRTYVVDAVPSKNMYYNGLFKVNGFTRPVILDKPPKLHSFGGQLARLKDSLSNPLEQITGIVFIGDSITWGQALGSENSSVNPRNGTLTDARDNSSSPSFVNEIKRYMGETYADGSAPDVSNWPTSPSGEAISEYTTENILYPRFGDFTLTTTGTSTSVNEVVTGGSITLYQLQLGAASTGTGVHTISFNFTGTTFTFCFGANVAALNYELFVDGVSQGVFNGVPGIDGVVTGNNNQRVHTFGYVRNKLIEIKTVQAGYIGTGILRVEGIIVNKKIRLTNQGINGATSISYKTNCMTGAANVIAVTPQDNYVFCQLGTNDRITSTTRAKGTNTFLINLDELINVITPLADLIMMCANPAIQDPLTYNMNMQQIRDVIYRLAKENSLDMIDNYLSWSNLEISSFSNDGLHPNALGHQEIARNIIGSLEMS